MTLVPLTPAQINAGLRAPGSSLGPSQFTYSIPTATSQWSGYAAGSEPFTSYSAFSAAQAASFRQAITLWDELIAPNFTEVADSGSSFGEIRVAFTGIAQQGVAGYAYSGSPRAPGSQVGDIWIDNELTGQNFTPPAPGSQPTINGFEILLHEIGHTLGLKHPFEGSPLPNGFDNLRYTVQSYTAAAQGVQVTFSGGGNSIGSASGLVPVLTPMLLDIAAAQAIYGADMTTRAGNTVYTFNQNQYAFQSIYDAGGTDTIDLSGFTRASIVDLRPGSYSSIGLFSAAQQIAFWTDQFPAFATFIAQQINGEPLLYTGVDNVGIAFTTVIENAIGGSGNDEIQGNDAANDLRGGAGDDALDGGIGNDILDGGAGADRLIGGAGNDSFFADSASDIVFESAGGGTDTVTARAGYYLFANVENLLLASGSGGIFGVGNDLANSLTGNEGANLLIGGAGGDIVSGGAGGDALFGEGGADTLNGDAGIDYLVGGADADVLRGGADADALYGEDGDDQIDGGDSFSTDILVGGAGNDVLDGISGQANPDFDLMDGGAGNDIYQVDTGDDLTFEGVGGGTDTVFANVPVAGAGVYLYANVENLVLLGTTSFGVGNELANSLTGNASGNFLLGGAGADVIDGGAGNDALFGEGGADRFVFGRGTGGDVIGDFQDGSDRIDLTAFGFTSFAQVQALIGQNGGTSFIALGGGDLIVINGVAMASLGAADFILG